MRDARKVAWLAVLAFLVTAPFAGHAQTPAPGESAQVTNQRFADGNDWTKSSVDEKQAFLFGIANAISVALGWDERYIPADQMTFSRRARNGLAGTSLGEALRRIDAWYAANPDRLDTPVVAVIWLDIAKPKLKGRK
ncbi:MAG: hypothetical protein U1E63_05075 [Burkholderiales bacterium]